MGQAPVEREAEGEVRADFGNLALLGVSVLLGCLSQI